MFGRKKKETKTEGLITTNDGWTTLFKKQEDDTKFHVLEDDDILWYCVSHGLSVNQDDYTADNLAKLKKLALEDQERIEVKNNERMKELIENEKISHYSSSGVVGTIQNERILKFCKRHGLSTEISYYTSDELNMMENAAIREDDKINREKIDDIWRNRDKLHRCLNGFKDL